MGVCVEHPNLVVGGVRVSMSRRRNGDLLATRLAVPHLVSGSAHGACPCAEDQSQLWV